MILQALVAVVAGLAHAISMGSPWDGQPNWWLQLLAMGALVWLLERSGSPRQSAWVGWFFSTAWLCGSFWWLYISMHTYGGLTAILTVLAIFSLAGVLALYYAFACYYFKALTLVNKAYSAIVFAALWMTAEMCRGIWFTGFGWGAAGYAHLESLAVFAKYIGAYGVAALAACLACQLALVFGGLFRMPFEARRLWRLLGVAVIVLAAAWPPHEFSSAGASMKVALMQGNISQDEKFQPGTGIADSLKWYGARVQATRADLVVAPETAIPVLPEQLPDDYWTALSTPFVGGKQALLIGIPLGSYTKGYTNSVIGLKPREASPSGVNAPVALDVASVYRYDKHHLVPFGEFIPPLFKWFTQMMNIPLGDFNRGAVGQPSFEWQGQRLAPNVCYEDLFGEELGARFADPAKAPTIFVNLSNIGWFGNTVAIDQHLNISRMRAMEFERPFIRATNTGATVIIDHTGHVTHALPRHTRGILLGEVQGRTGTAANAYGVTPYAWWVARFGLWPLWILGFGIPLLAFWRGRRHQ